MDSIVKTPAHDPGEAERDEPIRLMLAALDILDRGPSTMAAAALSLAITHAGGDAPPPPPYDASFADV